MFNIMKYSTLLRLYITLLCVNWILFETTAQPFQNDINSCPIRCTCSYSERLVNCSNRSLRRIPTPIPSWVSVLTFRNNKISGDEIQSEMFNHLHSLQEIDFSDNRLQEVNLTLKDVPQLRIVRFDRCSLKDFPEIGANIGVNITTLSLAHNAIGDIKNKLRDWPSLQYLDLSFNKLRHLRDKAFTKQNQLSELFLHKNKISVIEEHAFVGLNSLHTLSLSRNKLRTLVNLTPSVRKPPQGCVGNLRNLRHLDLSRNQVTTIKSLTFKGMCKLHTLFLNNNEIATLEDGAFYSLKVLKTLKMDANFISSVIKGWLFDLVSLQTLSLSNNNVSRIVLEGWSFCKELRHLNLSFNDLRVLSAGLFDHLSKLETLDLNHNAITVVKDDSFIALTSLHTLMLSNNRISSSVEDIEGAFNGLSSLHYLFLNNNKIRYLSADVLSGAERLIELDLRSNNITSVEEGIFDALTSLETLRMDSSAFICDCQLGWFSSWLSSHSNTNVTSGIKAFCFHPSPLKGRSLSSLQEGELECGKRPAPVFVQKPGSLPPANKGENVTLECSAAATITDGQSEGANVNMSAVWRRGPARDVIQEGPSIRILQQQRREGGHLFFSSFLLLYVVDYDDDKEYSCLIKNDFGEVMSDPARLQVYALPLIINRPQNKTVKLGSEVILNCQATGHPLPVISWQKSRGDFAAAEENRLLLGDVKLKQASEEEWNGSDNSEGDIAGLTKPRSSVLFGNTGGTEKDNSKEEGLVSVENAPLHIEKVKPIDAGEYTCMAKNDGGCERALVTLTVLYPPILEPMPDKVGALLGGNAVLKCKTRAYPAPEVTWSRNSKVLKGTPRHFLADSGQLLVIVEVRPEDEGTYICSVTNDLGTVRKNTTLVLKESSEEEISQNENIFDELFGNHGIVIVVVVICVLATSLIWLIVLCYTRRNQEGTYSTNTDSSDLPAVDSSSQGSLDVQLRSRSMQSSMNITGLQSRTDVNVSARYCRDHSVAPDLLAQSFRPELTRHPGSSLSNPVANLRHLRSYHYDTYSNIGRSPSNPVDNRNRFLVYDRRHVSARPPLRAASTSHVYNMQVDPDRRQTSVYKSAQCVSDTSPCKDTQRAAGLHRSTLPHSKRRRRRKRVDHEESTGESFKPTQSSSNDSSDEAGECQSLVAHAHIKDVMKNSADNSHIPGLMPGWLERERRLPVYQLQRFLRYPSNGETSRDVRGSVKPVSVSSKLPPRLEEEPSLGIAQEEVGILEHSNETIEQSKRNRLKLK